MGKKVEKALGKDKGAASASSQDHEDDPNKPPGMIPTKLNTRYDPQQTTRYSGCSRFDSALAVLLVVGCCYL